MHPSSFHSEINEFLSPYNINANDTAIIHHVIAKLAKVDYDAKKDFSGFVVQSDDSLQIVFSENDLSDPEKEKILSYLKNNVDENIKLFSGSEDNDNDSTFYLPRPALRKLFDNFKNEFPVIADQFPTILERARDQTKNGNYDYVVASEELTLKLLLADDDDELSSDNELSSSDSDSDDALSSSDSDEETKIKIKKIIMGPSRIQFFIATLSNFNPAAKAKNPEIEKTPELEVARPRSPR